MSVRSDTRAPGDRLDVRLLERARVGTLALDVTLVAGVSLVLGLIRLGTPSLWYDEAYTFRQLDRSYIEQFEGYQPFYYWLLKPWTGLVGTSEWAMRFPSVVGAMLACALVVVLAREVFDRRVALLSGLLLASSPFFVKWSQQARAYPWLVAGSLIATLLLVRALERRSRSAWAAYGIAYAALLVTHAVSGLLLLAGHVVLLAQRRERVLPHGLLAAVVVVGVGVPWVAQLAMRTDSETSETAWIPFPSAADAATALLAISGLAGLGLLFTVLGLWTLRRRGEGGLAVWLGTWAFAPFVLAVGISLARPVFVDRYLVIATPAFAMLAAVAIAGLAGWPRRLGVGVAVAATCVGLALWYGSDEPGNWRGEDWRGAVEAVGDRGAAADAVVVVPWWAHEAAQYYGAEVESVSSADSIWVLTWSETGHALPAVERAPLGFGEHRLVERQEFGWRVSAQLWKRPGTP